ncbi:MAG: glycosyltransferase family 4 protein [Bacteroidaceae bacterium]|nr:glycosyltransferase family 4 protein [Bacteroidaceae bacterium]
MKLLWINPSFLDYRIPLYRTINHLLNGQFSLIFSKRRVPQRCIDKIQKNIGENALGLEKDKLISFGQKIEFANKGISIPFTKGLYKLIKSSKPDIIIAEGFFQFTPLAVLYSFINRKPLLIAYERTAHTERNCPLWRRLYRRFIGIFVSGYIANGQLTKEYLISQGIKREKIFTGAMCADSEGLAQKVAALPSEEKKLIKTNLIGKEGNGLLYIFVGRIIELKGVNNLLEAWSEHIISNPKDKLLIVGDGPLLKEYQKTYPNKSIIFTGGIDYSDIYKYYAVSDVFIIPTLEDNWSLVVPEAMACGLPIACSIYNGCYPELVKKDINGITFDPLKKESIIETLAYFHTQDLGIMGKNSIEIEKKYNPENTANNIINAITHIYNSKK